MNKKEWFDPEVNELGVGDTECFDPTPSHSWHGGHAGHGGKFPYYSFS